MNPDSLFRDHREDSVKKGLKSHSVPLGFGRNQNAADRWKRKGNEFNLLQGKEIATLGYIT